MTDQCGHIGDYRAFAEQPRDRPAGARLDIVPFELSHHAFRVPEWTERPRPHAAERHASVNSETVWRRPISLILPAEPLRGHGGKTDPKIE